MRDSPAAYHRQSKKRNDRMQGGVVVSFTTVRHPPTGFPDRPIQIGIIALDDGSQVIAPVMGNPMIGDRVHPRMCLTRVDAQGLRLYDVAYSVVATVSTEARDPFEFHGYILALTGPSGVGKSTVSNLLGTVLRDFAARVPIITTRGPKEDDNGEYLYVSHEEFTALQDQGVLAAATQIPSTAEHRWYAYRRDDIEAIWLKKMIPIVVTEMHLLQGLSRTYGRRSILSCGLLPPGNSRRAMLSQLLHRLRTRGRDTEESIADRVRNAASDLDFFEKRKELFDHLLVNDNLDSVVDTIKGHVLRTQEEAA